MSDGCSVPKWLRFVIPQETPGQCLVCEKHDELYYYGHERQDETQRRLSFSLWVMDHASRR